MAQHAFEGALQVLASSDLEEARAENLVHDACAAVNVLAEAMKTLLKISADAGGSFEEASAWIRAVYVSWESVVREHRGVRVAQILDSVAPNLCASWLDALKSLAACAVVAKGMILRAKEAKEAKELEREDSRAVLEEDSVNWTGRGFLSAAWPELKDRGGLRSSRWRARVSAAEFLSSLAEYDFAGSKSDERLIEELLQALIFGMALVDSQWQVLRFFLNSYPLRLRVIRL